MYIVEFWSDDVAAAVDALPAHLLAGFAELRAALELAPWNVGIPYVASNPAGSRTTTLGADGEVIVVFGIRETDARVVTIIDVTPSL